jgi:hypothetical protein
VLVIFVVLTGVQGHHGKDSKVAVLVGDKTVAGLADVTVVFPTMVVGHVVVTQAAGAVVDSSRAPSVREKVNKLTDVL